MNLPNCAPAVFVHLLSFSSAGCVALSYHVYKTYLVWSDVVFASALLALAHGTAPKKVGKWSTVRVGKNGADSRWALLAAWRTGGYICIQKLKHK